MSKAKVSALRSVDLGFTDIDKAAKFFTDVWNLTPVGEEGGVHYFRATGPYHHVLTIRQTTQPSMIRMVFDAADPAAVDALHSQVKAHGLDTIDPPAKLRQPHGEYGFGFRDPEGRNIAIVCGVKDHADFGDKPDRPRKLSHVNINAGDSDATLACYRDALGFKDPEGRNIAIVCGVKDHADFGDKPDRPRKVSHVNINARDSDATLACYRDALGFKVSDTTRKFHFMTCNADHHNIVLGYTGGPTLNHIAFEMPDLESVMKGAGRMRDDGRPIEWGPGRHGPGHNVFCYFLGPDDMPIEYTAEMQQVDASYRTGKPEDWKWPPGRLDHWGITKGPSERIEAAGLKINFTDDGHRLDAWRA